MAGMTRATVLACLLLLWGCSPAKPDAPGQRYIVQLSAPPLVSYAGGVADLAPTSPQATGAKGVDPDSPASRAYTEYLKGQQAQLLAAVSETLGRPVNPEYAYYYALDGVVLRLTAAEATRIVKLPGVTSVRADLASLPLASELPRN